MPLQNGAERDIPEETKAGSRGGFLELLDDAFRLFVVRGDTTANEAVRSRQAVEQVHGDPASGSLQQLLGREKSGRSGAEDSNPQRVCCASNLAAAGETLNRGLLTTAAGGALVGPVVPGLLILCPGTSPARESASRHNSEGFGHASPMGGTRSRMPDTDRTQVSDLTRDLTLAELPVIGIHGA